MLLLGLCLGAIGPATAHEKTDVVTLDNGDRFHGEVRKLGQGALTVKTDNVGTLSVKWSHVASLVSRFHFEVEATSGMRYFGTLGEPDKAGELKVVGTSGTQVLPLTEVFWLAPIESGFWQKINGSINFGFSYTESNQAVQYNLAADAHYLTEKIGGDLQLNSIFNTQEDAESASNQTLHLTVFRPLNALHGRANVFGMGQLQSNPNQGFDLRSIAGAGAGLFLHQSSGGFTVVSVGVVGDRENVTASPEVTTDAEAMLGFRFSRYRTDYPKRSINLSVSTFAYLTNSPRFRTQASFKIGWEIIHNLNVSFHVLDTYDSRPATEDAAKNDLSVTTSLGYTF